MIVSPEALLDPVEGRFDDRAAVSEAWANATRQFRDALADPQVLDAGIMIGWPGSGKSTWAAAHDDTRIVLFDAVWADRARRIAIANRIRRARKNAVAVWVRTPLPIALDRNAARPAWRRVPEAVVREYAIALLRDSPTRTEGTRSIVWDRVIVVPGA